MDRAASTAWSLPARMKAALHRVLRRHLWQNTIGDGTAIHPTAYIDRTWPRGIVIGKSCRIHEQAVVLTHDFTRGIYLDTRIGDRTVIGHRAIIMPGVTIGADCVILPGAVVLRDLPDNHIAAGNPAQASPRDSQTVEKV